MSKLLTVYDDQEPLNNVISALTLNAEEVFFVYHHEVSRNTFANIEKVINKYLTETQIHFMQLNDDEKQLNEILDRNPDSVIDVGAAGKGYLVDLVADVLTLAIDHCATLHPEHLQGRRFEAFVKAWTHISWNALAAAEH